MQKKGTVSIIALLLLATITVFLPTPTNAQQTEVKVINPNTGDSSFVFYWNETSVGTRFNATVWIYNVTDLFSFQVNLIVNDTLLNITNAWIPSQDNQYVFFGKSTVPVGPTYYDFDNDNTTERVLIGSTILGADSFTGSGLLAIIEMEIIYIPVIGEVVAELNIDNSDTILLDSTLEDIPAIRTNGTYRCVGPIPPLASFTYSPSLPLVNMTITFDASPSTPNGGAIANYTWNFDDGNETTVTQPTITHTYTYSGVFNVTLTVMDTEGLSDTTWKNITVYSKLPVLKVDPPSVSTEYRTFNVTVKIENIEENSSMIGFQFRLLYNSSILKVLNVIEGPFLQSFPQRPTPPYTYFMWFDEPDDPYYGSHVVVGNLLLPNDTGQWPGPFPQGEGILATIVFNAIASEPGPFTLTFNDTMIIDSTNSPILHITMDGTYEFQLSTATITSQPLPSYEVFDTASAKFTVQYPNGSYYTSNNLGSITVKVHNGTDFVDEITLSTNDFNSTTNEWTVEWQIPTNVSATGNYSFVILSTGIADNIGTLIIPEVSSQAFKIKLISTESPTTDSPIYINSGEAFEITIKYTEQNPLHLTITLSHLNYTIVETNKTAINPGVNVIATFNLTIPITAPEGEYNLTVTMFNIYNMSLTDTQFKAVIVDDTTPVISDPYQNPPGQIVQPGITVEVDPGQNVTIRVNVTDANLKEVILSYNTTSMQWQNITMYPTSGSEFEATIPSSTFPVDTMVYYRIIAIDKADNVAISPTNELYFQYNVIPEFNLIMMLLIMLISTMMTLTLRKTVFKRKV